MIMKDELSIEKEFSRVAYLHKLLIISCAMSVFKGSLLNNDLVKEVIEKTEVESGVDTEDIPLRILEFTRKYDSTRLDKIYKLCWQKVKRLLPENKVYKKVIKGEIQ